MKPSIATELSRRHFLTQAGAGLAATLTLSRAHAQGSVANSRIRLGLIGCGQRGQWILDLFAEHGGYEVAAVADYFPDKVAAAAARHKLGPRQVFTGLQCAEKMIAAGGLDAVAIISPPYFHPAQASAAVAAGLHVFLAKPVAVDVPGCHSIQASADEARRKRRVFLVDFQTRTNELFIEAIRRVHAGAMGEICFGEATNHVEGQPRKADPGPPEARLRNWIFDRALSGEIIVEQNIHVLDVMSWVMKETPPLRCTGTGGLKVRRDVGDCWDHFALVYEYAQNVGVTFSARQFKGHGSPGGFVNRMFGSKGTLSTAYGGEVMIRGGAEVFFRGGKAGALYKEGAVANIASFHEQVTAGDAANATVAPSVTSNLIAILGRTAARRGRTVTWQEIMQSKERVEADLSGLQA